MGLQSTKQFNLEFPHQNPQQFRETTKLEYPLSYGLLKTNKCCAFICSARCTEAANMLLGTGWFRCRELISLHDMYMWPIKVYAVPFFSKTWGFAWAELLIPPGKHTTLTNQLSLYHTRLIGPCAPSMGQTGTHTSPRSSPTPPFSHTHAPCHVRRTEKGVH